jgi:hypothetical protein
MMRGKPHCVTAVPSFLGVPRTFRGLAWCARFAAKLTLPGCHPSSLRGVLPELLPGSSRNYSRISLVVKRRWSGRWFEKRSRLLFRCIGHVLNDTFSIGWLGCGGHDARQRLEGVPSEWAPVMDPLIHHVFVLWSVIDRRAKDRPRPRAVPTSILVQGKVHVLQDRITVGFGEATGELSVDHTIVRSSMSRPSARYVFTPTRNTSWTTDAWVSRSTFSCRKS